MLALPYAYVRHVTPEVSPASKGRKISVASLVRLLTHPLNCDHFDPNTSVHNQYAGPIRYAGFCSLPPPLGATAGLTFDPSPTPFLVIKSIITSTVRVETPSN